MSNEDMAPLIDKVLHADGSVTTLAGEEFLPADPNRAKEFQSRAANADKWLHADGSVTDAAGNVILEADESRARDYASRMALAAGLPGGSTGGSAFRIQEGPVSAISVPYLKPGETSESPITLDGMITVTDAAGAVLT